MILAWVITTPLGTPVDPDVKRMWAASWGLVAHGSGESGAESTSFHRKTTPPLSPGSSGANHPMAADLPASGKRPSRRAAEGVDASKHFGSQASTILARRGAGLPVSSGT